MDEPSHPIFLDYDKLELITKAILYELREAHRKWPNGTKDPLQHLAIIMEELGEAARELNDRWNVAKPDWHRAYRMELIQTAAMCVRALLEDDEL